ncbi:hypothetical protein ASE93_15305 [Serratia sp. Leaf50]|nr:hypothetical protein ASE93_15305 [Serratia sp. Leaf50]
MAEPRILYDSEDTYEPVDNVSVIVEGDQGEPLLMSSLMQKSMRTYDPSILRELYGIASKIHEQAGEIALGSIDLVNINDLPLNDPTISDAKVVTIIANHAEAINRISIVTNIIIRQLNTYFAYAHNEKAVIPYTAPKT